MSSIRPTSAADFVNEAILRAAEPAPGAPPDDELPPYSEVAGTVHASAPARHHGAELLPSPSALPLTARAYAPPPPLDAAVLGGPLWDTHENAALDALDTLMRLNPHGLGQEDVLCNLARTSPLHAVRVAATDKLGETPSVRAVDRLLELFWWGDAQIHEQAKFRLSPGTVQDLCYEAKDTPEEIDRCLRDLALFAPSDSRVPEEAVWALRTRSDTSRLTACDALCAIAARSPDPLALIAYQALKVCATADDWRDNDYGTRLRASVNPDVATAAD